ncbi:MAG: hypothetical protein JO089_09230 [Alphaproteobacteria bacterium]|nr:hypothetical protein [Alphaproteobacteria bacterium]
MWLNKPDSLLQKKPPTPMPPWLKWGLLAFLVYGAISMARHPVQGVDWQLMDTKRYKQQMFGPGAGPPPARGPQQTVPQPHP